MSTLDLCFISPAAEGDSRLAMAIPMVPIQYFEYCECFEHLIEETIMPVSTQKTVSLADSEQQ